jgi:hypothetical protein
MVSHFFFLQQHSSLVRLTLSPPNFSKNSVSFEAETHSQSNVVFCVKKNLGFKIKKKNKKTGFVFQQNPYIDSAHWIESLPPELFTAFRRFRRVRPFFRPKKMEPIFNGASNTTPPNASLSGLSLLRALRLERLEPVELVNAYILLDTGSDFKHRRVLLPGPMDLCFQVRSFKNFF